MNAFDAAYLAGGLLLAPVWARKARSGWDERLGKIASLGETTRPRLLIHGVSVGEVNALRELVPMLRGEAGGLDVVVSATTDTGLKRAREVFGEGGDVVRYPLDFSWSVRRFLDAVKPDAVALCELEVWPNFVRECERRGVPVVVINGRLSERSFKGYRRARPLLHGTFARLSQAAVQDETYAERFRAMGVAPDRVRVLDTMKWDTAKIADDVPGADELAQAMKIDLSRPLIVAGSTGPGEEAMFHEACPPGAQLLCAPRKPERFDEAAAALPGCVRRSWTLPGASRPSNGPGLATTKHRFLLDTIGELRAAYALANVVIVGRSFGTLHGSDPIEPIGLGRPTIIGPRYGDFSTIVDALREAGGIEVAAAGDLRRTLQAMLENPARGAAMAERGRACIRAHQGATARHAELLINLTRGAAQARRAP